MKQKALTIRFWNIQLYLMQSNELALKNAAIGLINYSTYYKANKYTPKAMKLLKKPKLSRKEHDCLSTHIALQVVGIHD